MAASSASSDGSQQANLVSNENAETMFGADQAETNMVKLVDGKLTPMGDTDDDVMDEQLRNRYSSDEERSLQGYTEKTYENSDASLRGAEDVKPDASNDAQETTGTYVVEDNGPASENDEMTYTLEEGSEPNEPATTAAANDGTPTSRIQSSGADQTNTFSLSITSDMVPMTPSTPDPTNPVPAAPETPTPPTPPSPGPEIPDLPGSPSPDRPEITEPSEPGRSHEINGGGSTGARTGTFHYSSGAPLGPGHSNFGGFATRTSTVSVDQNHVEPTPDQVEPGEAVPGTQYVNMSTGIDEAEGMESTPDTGEADYPYKADGNEPTAYKPGERPEELEEMMTNPRQAADESLTKVQEMIGEDADRSEVKSTEGLDLPYNDPQSVRDRTAY
ncbi:hypothetical protein [Fibrella arboris]|uniref:hypothetical protein n=1 Tax=Fibrella arboris TaxID=3242486 RepID=UPI00352265B1